MLNSLKEDLYVRYRTLAKGIDNIESDLSNQSEENINDLRQATDDILNTYNYLLESCCWLSEEHRKADLQMKIVISNMKKDVF
jgi:hypothetical protein